MTVGSWNPEVTATAKQTQLPAETLSRLLQLGCEENLDKLAGVLTGDEAQMLSATITMEHAVWLETAKPLPDASLLTLIQFFAVAENLPGWEAMEKSPVIPLAKTLRQRGTRLDKDFLQWLRSVSSNRYLPYGPL